MVANTREHVDKILDQLQVSGIVAYLSEPPPPAELRANGQFRPFVVVHTDAGVADRGSIADPSADLRIAFQITAVGETAEQALWMSDQARLAINRFEMSVTGRSVWPVYSAETPAPVRRDDQINPPLFVATSRWQIYSQPA